MLPNTHLLQACQAQLVRCYAVDLDSASLKTSVSSQIWECASQGKVKFIADAIWSKLSGVFSKEVLHAQHVSVFCHILQVTATIIASTVSSCWACNLMLDQMWPGLSNWRALATPLQAY